VSLRASAPGGADRSSSSWKRSAVTVPLGLLVAADEVMSETPRVRHAARF